MVRRWLYIHGGGGVYLRFLPEVSAEIGGDVRGWETGKIQGQEVIGGWGIWFLHINCFMNALEL
jgi:hypothetical protein